VTTEELQPLAGAYGRLRGSRGRDFTCEVRGRSLVDMFNDEAERMTPLGNGVFWHLNVFIVFDTTDPASIRLRAFRKSGALIEDMQRIPSVPWPGAAALEPLAGTYYNHELDVTWSLVSANGRLALKRERMANVVLWPSAPDRYLLAVVADPEAYTYDVELRLIRDASSAVTGFEIWSSRLRGGLAFQRVAPPGTGADNEAAATDRPVPSTSSCVVSETRSPPSSGRPPPEC
jgi:hypothetical protein